MSTDDNMHLSFRKADPADRTVIVELQTINADLAVYAGLTVLTNIVLIDAMINDVPLVSARLTYNRIMGRAVDLLGRILNRDNGILCHLDLSKRTVGRSISYMISKS